MIAGTILVLLILMGLFAPFLSPYSPTIAGRDKDYTNGAPQIPKFCDEAGCSWRPFIYGVKRERSMATNFRWVTSIDTEDRRYVQFFVEGQRYRLFGIPMDTHLFGVDKGFIHLFGTDDTGKELTARDIYEIFEQTFIATDRPYAYVGHHFIEDSRSEEVHLTGDIHIDGEPARLEGRGNGPIDAFGTADGSSNPDFASLRWWVRREAQEPARGSPVLSR